MKVDEAKERSNLDNERKWNIEGIHFETENSVEWADIEEEFTASGHGNKMYMW
jgi:hypothetical protein